MEDQVNDRLSFQRFAGINYTTTVPDFTTIWHFKEALIREGLMEKLFGLIIGRIARKGAVGKKRDTGGCVDNQVNNEACERGETSQTQRETIVTDRQ